MTTRNAKRQLRNSVFAGGLMAALTAAGQAAPQDFAIPAQPLDEALLAFSEQSGLSVLIDAELAHGHQTKPLNARAEPEEALRRLLDGTGLEIDRVDDTTWSIRTKRPERAGLERTRFASLLQASDFQATPPPPPSEAPTRPMVVEEMLVTARKIQESEQSVPVAITVLSAEDLLEAQINQLDGLQGSIPNVNIVQGRGSTSNVNIFVRGVGQPDALQTFDPAVGVFIDGVFLSRIQGALLNLFDVQSVEVLRGPQGTVFGKNTAGGAIVVNTRTPGDEWEVLGRASYGRFDEVQLDGYIGGPIVEDKLFASVSAGWLRNDGFVVDPATGTRFNDDNSFTVRGKMVFKPIDDLTLEVSADYTRQRTQPTLGRAEADLLITELGIPGLVPPGVTVAVPAPTETYDFTGATSLAPGQGQELDHWGISLNATWDLNDIFTLKSITAYRELEPDFFIDIDATALELGDVGVFVDQDQFSQELQLQFVDPGWGLSGVFGVFYLTEDLQSDQFSANSDAFTFGLQPLNFDVFIEDSQDLFSIAGFGEVNWDVTSAFTVTAGVRVTYEEKDFATQRVTVFGAPLGILSSTFPASTLDPTTLSQESLDAFDPVTASEDFFAVTPRVIAKYNITDNNNVYASVSRGFKSGGFNGRATNEALLEPFDEETVWTFELGSKNEFFNRRVRVNLAAFYNRYEDFQARVSDVVPSGDPAIPDTFIFPVLNAGQLDIFGIEAEFTALVTENLTLTGSLGYLNADFIEFEDPEFLDTNGFPRDQQEVPFAPDITASIGFNYEQPLGDLGFVSLAGNLVYVDEQFLSLDIQPVLFEDGYALLDFFLSWEDPDRMFRVFAGVENVTDEVYATDAQEFSSVANIQTLYYGDPRTWTVGFSFQF